MVSQSNHGTCRFDLTSSDKQMTPSPRDRDTGMIVQNLSAAVIIMKRRQCG